MEHRAPCSSILAPQNLRGCWGQEVSELTQLVCSSRWRQKERVCTVHLFHYTLLDTLRAPGPCSNIWLLALFPQRNPSPEAVSCKQFPQRKFGSCPIAQAKDCAVSVLYCTWCLHSGVKRFNLNGSWLWAEYFLDTSTLHPPYFVLQTSCELSVCKRVARI